MNTDSTYHMYSDQNFMLLGEGEPLASPTPAATDVEPTNGSGLEGSTIVDMIRAIREVLESAGGEKNPQSQLRLLALADIGFTYLGVTQESLDALADFAEQAAGNEPMGFSV